MTKWRGREVETTVEVSLREHLRSLPTQVLRDELEARDAGRAAADARADGYADIDVRIDAYAVLDAIETDDLECELEHRRRTVESAITDALLHDLKRAMVERSWDAIAMVVYALDRMLPDVRSDTPARLSRRRRTARTRSLSCAPILPRQPREARSDDGRPERW
jgi:hypothetical protein